jgi:hypothetical protein
VPNVIRIILIGVKQIERLRQLRLNLMTEHTQIASAMRRAMFELEVADFDLRAAENRLEVAEKQSELAARGMLVYVEDDGPH